MDTLMIPLWVQWLGGGSVVTIALATLRAIMDTRDEIRLLRRDLGRTDIAPKTGLFGEFSELKSEFFVLRDWAVSQGYERRHRRREADE